VPLTVEIEPQSPEETQELYALAHSTFAEEGGFDQRRACDVLEQDTVFVAHVGRSLVGYVALHREPDAVQVDQLLVASPYQGQRIGHRLLAYVEGYAIAEGATSLRIVVEEGNRRAREFYRRWGFVPVADELFELTLPLP
jgi:GNAT superfamily N-acetyltransferase